MKSSKTKLVNLFTIIGVIVFVLAGLGLAKSAVYKNSLFMTVYADRNSSGSDSNNNSPEVKQNEADNPEPSDTPEPTNLEKEKNTEIAKQEIENKISNNEVKNIEVNPANASGSGASVNIENQNGQNTKRAISFSNSPIITLQKTSAGTVSINVSSNGTVTINNNGVMVQTQDPIIIDPVSKTLAIKTPSGITIINTLPSQALNSISPAYKPTVLNSMHLSMQNGAPVYQTTGILERHLFGIIPVSADVSNTISAQNGRVLNSQAPWFFQSLGFLFTI